MIYEEYEKEGNEVSYKPTREGRIAYHKKINAITERFRKALESHYCVEDCKQDRKDKLWDLAWVRGHSGGYSEIEGIYIELADLIR